MCIKKIIEKEKNKIWQDILLMADIITAKRKLVMEALDRARCLDAYLDDNSSLIMRLEENYIFLGFLLEQKRLFRSVIYIIRINRLLETIRDEVVHVW